MNQARLEELLNRYVDGTLTDPQQRELERALLDMPDARRAFWRFAGLHGMIRDNFQSQTGRQVAAETVPPIILHTEAASHQSVFSDWFSKTGLFSYAVATLVVALLIFGFWAHEVNHDAKLATKQSSQPTHSLPAAIVGNVTGLSGCKWSGGAAPTFSGDIIRLGRKYSLDDGLVEITYRTGAKVILEGPCEYEVDSATGGYLAVGKLIARVEAGGGESGSRGIGESGSRKIGKSERRENSLGTSSKKFLPNNQPAACGFARLSNDSASPAPLFAIRTPSAVVTDLGTEFGVIVGDDGDTATHVIEGRVELRVRDDDRPEHQAIRIAAGESVHVERSAKDAENDLAAVARGKADADLFTVHPGKLTEYVAEKRLEQFHRWQAFSDELCKRDDLVDYWDFQRDKKNPLVFAQSRAGRSRWHNRRRALGSRPLPR